MLPWEVLCIICDFSMLGTRYHWMQTCKHFSSVDWKHFGSTYRLWPCTKTKLMQIVTRQYNADWVLSSRLQHVWSENMSQPLKVWSPWSRVWYPRVNSVAIFLKHSQFVHFVRDIGRALSLRTPCIQVRNHQKGVIVHLWHSSRLKARVSHSMSNTTKSRMKWASIFKKKTTQMVRVLLSFQILQDRSLWAKPSCLHFLSSN